MNKQYKLTIPVVKRLQDELAAVKQEKNDWKIASQTNVETIKLLSDRIDVYINRIAELEAQWSDAYDVWTGATNIEGIRADERHKTIEEVAAWMDVNYKRYFPSTYAQRIRAKFLSTPSSEAPHD